MKARRIPARKNAELMKRIRRREKYEAYLAAGGIPDITDLIYAVDPDESPLVVKPGPYADDACIEDML